MRVNLSKRDQVEILRSVRRNERFYDPCAAWQKLVCAHEHGLLYIAMLRLKTLRLPVEEALDEAISRLEKAIMAGKQKIESTAHARRMIDEELFDSMLRRYVISREDEQDIEEKGIGGWLLEGTLWHAHPYAVIVRGAFSHLDSHTFAWNEWEKAISIASASGKRLVIRWPVSMWVEKVIKSWVFNTRISPKDGSGQILLLQNSKGHDFVVLGSSCLETQWRSLQNLEESGCMKNMTYKELASSFYFF